MRPSIIIPTFNRADLVGKAIQASLDQTFESEVIVCDHGSQDDTQDVVREFGSSVTYIRREDDFGPHFCWLEGVLHASGDLIHFQYDDDWIEPEFMARTVELMGDDVGFAFTNASIADPNTGLRHSSLNFLGGKFDTGIHPSSRIEKRLLRGRVVSPAACVFRKPVVIDAIYQGRLPLAGAIHYHGVGPDMFMMLLSMLRYPTFAYINDELAIFGEHAGSITVSAQTDSARQQKLDDAYRSVGQFYQLLRTHKRHRSIMNFLARF